MIQPLKSPATFVPNLAPMVDVIMVLLVFFLLGASLSLSEQGVLQTELDPRSGPGVGIAVQINPRITIALEDRRGGAAAHVTVVDEALGENAFAELRSYLSQRRDLGADLENPIVVGADTGVRWKFVVRAMDAAVSAGFHNIQFAVSMAGEDGR